MVALAFVAASQLVTTVPGRSRFEEQCFVETPLEMVDVGAERDAGGDIDVSLAATEGDPPPSTTTGPPTVGASRAAHGKASQPTRRSNWARVRLTRGLVPAHANTSDECWEPLDQRLRRLRLL